MDAEEIQEIIDDVISHPAEVSGDAGSVKQHSIDDLLKAKAAANSTNVAARLGFGMRVQKIEPPGCG